VRHAQQIVTGAMIHSQTIASARMIAMLEMKNIIWTTLPPAKNNKSGFKRHYGRR